MKKIICFIGAVTAALAACSSTETIDDSAIIEAPVMSAYYSDWDRAVRADVDMQNMYMETPSKITKPIDMYMAMALALKYNYTRRLATYRENLVKSNISPSALSSVAASLGYTDNASAIPADLKASWNLLDVSAFYYENGLGNQEVVAEEQSRVVINSIMLQARTLYWKALAAQRLIPVIDDMNEYLVRVVDEINARANDMAQYGQSPSTTALLKKRKYLENIQELANLRRKLETAQTEFVGLLGLYPSTEIKLAGSEYGNFAIPSLRAKMSQLEWLALTNRPELRIFDSTTSPEELELVIKGTDDVDNSDYRQNPSYYNRKWSKESSDLAMTLFEDVRYQGTDTYNSLARQRMTHIILNQVYLSWAMYQSAVENYYLSMGVATTSEDIAEDITTQEGSNRTISHLESARAIVDEANAFLAYIDVQEAIGRLYASVGMDAVPAYMLNESPSSIAVQIHESLDKWRDGIFYSVPKGAKLSLSGKKPPVDVSSQALVPDMTVGTGSLVYVVIPEKVFAKINWKGPYRTTAGSIGATSLPAWLSYNPDTRTLSGTPSLEDEGSYLIKIFALDDRGTSAVLSFIITVKNLYIHTMEYKGLTGYRRAKVYHRCVAGEPCPSNDI